MAKGGEYERQICRLLSDWWLGKPAEDVIFWRTAGSGGRSTSRGKKGQSAKLHAGDICAVDPIGQPLIDTIVVEIKRGYSKYTIADLLDKGPKAALQEWEKWHIQATEAAERAGTKYWLIVQRRDQRIPIVFFPVKLWDALDTVAGDWLNFRPLFELTLDSSENAIIGTKLESFLGLVKPEYIRKLANDK